MSAEHSLLVLLCSCSVLLLLLPPPHAMPCNMLSDSAEWLCSTP
jgi:hypothetical protein